MARLRLLAGLLRPADAVVHPFEIMFNRLDAARVAALGPGEVTLLQLVDPPLGRDVGVVGSSLTVFGLADAPLAALAALTELDVGAPARVGDEIHVVPHSVEFFLLVCRQDQLVERLVVAEEAKQVVEAGAEVPGTVASGVEITAAALLHVKPVGKYAAELREGGLVSSPLPRRGQQV